LLGQYYQSRYNHTSQTQLNLFISVIDLNLGQNCLDMGGLVNSRGTCKNSIGTSPPGVAYYFRAVWQHQVWTYLFLWQTLLSTSWFLHQLQNINCLYSS
jgi:hypothetical protein